MIQTFTEEEQDKLLALIQQPGWDVLVAIGADRVADLTQKIISGNMTHDEYLAATGELAGLRYAGERIRQIVRQRPEGASDAN